MFTKRFAPILFLLLTAVPALLAQTSDAPGVIVDTGGAQLMHRTGVMYPEAARTNHIQGIVSVQVSLDSAGSVSDARALSGPLELRNTVLQSVLRWHFTRDSANSTRQVSVTFQTPPTQPQAPAMQNPNVVLYLPQSGSGPGRTLSRIEVAGFSDQIRDQLLAALPFHEGDTLNADDINKLCVAVRGFDEHVNPMVVSAAPSQPAIRMSSEAGPSLLRRVMPVYPPDAKLARIQGVVKLKAVIGRDGAVQDLKVISGHPMLGQAALDAVRQWVYQPTLLNGSPVEVTTDIDVNFTVSQ